MFENEALYTESEKEYLAKVEELANNLAGGEIDDLIALVEHGPLHDGDVPSKAGRDSLLDKKLAVRVVVNGQDGYQAASYLGADVYCKRYNGDTLREAIQNRLEAKRVADAKAEPNSAIWKLEL